MGKKQTKRYFGAKGETGRQNNYFEAKGDRGRHPAAKKENPNCALCLRAKQIFDRELCSRSLIFAFSPETFSKFC